MFPGHQYRRPYLLGMFQLIAKLFKVITILYRCTGWFMFHMISNDKARFAQGLAQIAVSILSDDVNIM